MLVQDMESQSAKVHSNSCQFLPQEQEHILKGHREGSGSEELASPVPVFEPWQNSLENTAHALIPWVAH